jgi:nucleotide-binding universal stress UspA family protein
MTSILAPTDLSDSSIPALRYARLFADRFAARLTILYSEPILYPVSMGGAGEGLYLDPTPQHRAQLRAEVVRQAGPLMNERAYDVEVTIGHPVPTILTAARNQAADLVVMGTHLRHGWRRALIGSVSEGVLHGCECPVLTVATQDGFPAAKPHDVTHVLCPVNFTDLALDSLRVAARLAEAFGAALTVVHVLERDHGTNLAEAEARVRSWIGPELQDGCSYRELVLRGGPSERVLDCAEDIGVDLLVIGAQHRLFRDATVIGTTTERVIRFASCPVLVVPRVAATRETAAGLTEAVGELAMNRERKP